MSLTAGQQKVLAIHSYFHQGLAPDGKTHINLVEHNSDNHVWIHDALRPYWPGDIGWAWCAGTTIEVGLAAGVLEVKDGSWNAWADTDHMASLPGGRVLSPEPAALCSINEGDGHVFTLLQNIGGNMWLCGEGNWGDCYQWTHRDMSATPIHSMARYPGVAAEIAAAAHPTPAPKPSGAVPWWFKGRPDNEGIGTSGGHIGVAKKLLGMGAGDVANHVIDAKMCQWLKVYQIRHKLKVTAKLDTATAISLGG